MNYGYNNNMGTYGYQPQPMRDMNTYNNMNNLLSQQQQLQQMQQAQQAQQLPQAPSLQQTPQTVQPTITFVGSIDEVKAHPVDWTGGTSYFMDKSNGNIYTKGLNTDGLVKINTYKLDNTPEAPTIQEEVNLKDYVKREEFEGIKNTIDNLLTQLGVGTEHKEGGK